MQAFLRKLLAASLAVLILIMPSMYVIAQEPAARNLSVYRVDGE